ncbi:hypothetical protein HY413_01465 [Candidatus Kaiserbacteria bacterium]|nr:hypothetical protein [Candidatus Kaiserbacteria bacterium]
MNLRSFNHFRRFVVNGILGAALFVPLWLIVTGAYIIGSEQITIFDWKSVNWVHASIVALFGAAAFHYLSVVYARTREWQNKILLMLVALGGAVCALGSVDMLCYFFDKEVTPNIVSIIGISLAGITFGLVVWLRANGVSLQQLLQKQV